MLPDNQQLAPASEQTGNQLFPVFLKLNELNTVLIGGGNVGLEKLNAILNNSPHANVTVVALTILPELYQLALKYKTITIRHRAFEAHDLDNAQLVVAATNNDELNLEIRQAAHERKLLINVADKPALCDFYLGAIVQKGDLKIAISTNGKSPTVAKRLKEVLTEGLPNEIDTTLQQLSQLRNSLKGDFAFKVKKLNKATAVLVKTKPVLSKEMRIALVAIAFAALVAFIWFL